MQPSNDPTILWQSNDILVINKPVGMIAHGDGKSDEHTIADWVRATYPESSDVGEPLTIETNGTEHTIRRSGIVHRLDRETSGVMIIARTQQAFLHLKSQFQSRTITKEYIAIVRGGFKIATNDITTPIGRSKSDIRKWATGRGVRGVVREAHTTYTCTTSFVHDTQTYSVVHVWPKTGRTHQIRVHMSSISRPLVGDTLYGAPTKTELGIGRVALHAYKITFEGLDGQKHTITAPLPEDIAKYILL